MQISCVHCGEPFTITREQLGGRGNCPHCRGLIQLPGADESPPDPASVSTWRNWWENSISTLASVVFHMALMLVLALISYGANEGAGIGEEVLIGELPAEEITQFEEEELTVETVDESDPVEETFEELEVTPPTSTSEAEPVNLVELNPLSSGGDDSAFNLGSVTIAAGGGGGSWDGMLQTLRRNGLDIVVTFDSTGSMGGEIREVKEQIKRIGGTLMKLVPKARISICTYRDDGDEYVVRGLPLTNDLQEIERYLAAIYADEGGDTPEAVHRGMQWAIRNNSFRSRARKVVLLFGDAPPHRYALDECLSLASDFHRQQEGIVSTVTCRRPVRLREFEEIAQMGGGEAFLTADERQIMNQLLILVFGSRYKSKVLEAFELMK